MIYRKALEELKKWRTSNRRKQLIVRGEGQVGKTTVVTAFAKEFKQLISLNLKKTTDAQIFQCKKTT